MTSGRQGSGPSSVRPAGRLGDIMSTEPTQITRVSESAPEQVAFRLLEIIASIEGKTLAPSATAPATANRKWILDTYAECFVAVTQPWKRIA